MFFLKLLTTPREELLWLMPLLVDFACMIAVFKVTSRPHRIFYLTASCVAAPVWLGNLWLLKAGLIPAPIVVTFSVITGLLLGFLGFRQFVQKRPNTWFWSLLQIGAGLVLLGSGLWVAAYNGLSNTDNPARMLMSWGLWILVVTLLVAGTIRGVKKLTAKVRDRKKPKNKKKTTKSDEDE